MLEYILNSRPKIKILKLLFDRSEWIFTESEIARELSLPKATTHRALKFLRDQNIVRELKKSGRLLVFQLNKDNYIVKELLEPIIKKDNIIIEEKAKGFSKKIKEFVDIVILFGSSIKGELKPTSDIDLALVTDDPKKLESIVNKLKTEYLEKQSIIFSTHVFDKKDFKKRYAKQDPLIREIANGKIIYGDIEEVI
jgi:predicted nucleotidyltransferase